MNVIERLELELTNFEAVVQHLSHYAARTPPLPIFGSISSIHSGNVRGMPGEVSKLYTEIWLKLDFRKDLFPPPLSLIFLRVFLSSSSKNCFCLETVFSLSLFCNDCKLNQICIDLKMTFSLCSQEQNWEFWEIESSLKGQRRIAKKIRSNTVYS